MSRRYIRKHSGPILDLVSKEGLSVRRLCRLLSTDDRTIRRALEELRMSGFVHPVHTRLAYLGKWPELGDPLLASILRRLRRKPCTRDEFRALYPDIRPKEIDQALHYLAHKKHIAPAALVWASTFQHAPR